MLHLSPLLRDGAVLCRRKEIRIFGEADEGARIRCELLDGQGTLLGEAEAETVGGRFLALIPPQEAGYHCKLRVSGAGETVCALDISIGEVYLAGGQSNMEMELSRADEGPELVRTHVNPMVRYFNIPRFAYPCGEADRAFEEARWQAVGPGRAGDMSAVAYFFAMKLQRRLEVPVGIIDCYWGGTSVTAWMDREWLCRTTEGKRYLEEYEALSGGKSLEVWQEETRVWQAELDAWNAKVEVYKQAHPTASGAEVNREVGPCPWNPPAGPGSPYRPAALFDTMVARAVPMTLSGFLWYQGENDAGLTDQYDVLLTSMIDRWRTAFREDSLPFLLVQLPMWIASYEPEDTYTWPAIRLAQTKVRDQVRNCAMVCLLDQGEWDNLHPTAKRVVGERLCDAALRLVYGQECPESPRATGKRTENGMLTVTLSEGVLTSDGKEPALLELAGADGVFHPARAMLEGGLLRLRACGVSVPVSVRYAWTDFAQVNLFSAEGLPLEPFRL